MSPHLRRLAFATLLVAGCMPEFPKAMGQADAATSSDAAGAGGGADAPAAPDGGAPTADAAPPSGATLTVSFVTTENGGNYAPKNIVAAWIEGPSGTFVKTIGRWAGTRRSHLVAWTAKAGAGDVDAVSGATRASHAGTLSIVWDLTDRSGAEVPDGTYTVRLELADRNSSTEGQNHQGTFTFVKGPTASTQNVEGGGFLNVVLDYAVP